MFFGCGGGLRRRVSLTLVGFRAISQKRCRATHFPPRLRQICFSFALGSRAVCATAQRQHCGKCKMGDGLLYHMCTSHQQHAPACARRRSIFEQIKLQRGVDLLAPDLTPVAALAWNATTPIACAPSRFNELRVPVVWPLL